MRDVQVQRRACLQEIPAADDLVAAGQSAPDHVRPDRNATGNQPRYVVRRTQGWKAPQIGRLECVHRAPSPSCQGRGVMGYLDGLSVAELREIVAFMETMVIDHG